VIGNAPDHIRLSVSVLIVTLSLFRTVAELLPDIGEKMRFLQPTCPRACCEGDLVGISTVSI